MVRHACTRAASSDSLQSRVSRLLENIPYTQVFTNHDEKFQATSGISMTSAQSYKNYSLTEIVKAFNSSMIARSFLEKGTFDRLLQRLSHKLYLLTKQKDVSMTRHQDNNKSNGYKRNNNNRNIVIPMHLLFVGGSVCYGHHSFLNESSGVNASTDTSDTTAMMRADAHLSWPRRLIALLTYAVEEYTELLSPLPGVTVHLQISPRYCCRPATSTTHAVDVFKSMEYRHGRCSHDLLTTDPSPHTPSHPPQPPWEPDMVLWDYAVNDLHSHWFQARPREYVYENMVRLFLKLDTTTHAATTHAAQIIDFEFINHKTPPSQMKTAVSQRLKINRYYAIPVVDYMSALALASNDLLRDYTPLYAEKLSNKHPAWPTHIVWAQLALGVILTGLMQWKDFLAANAGVDAGTDAGVVSATPPLLTAAKYKYKHNYSHQPVLHNPPANHKEYLGICNKKGYSSFYDFSDIKDSVDRALLRSMPSIFPVKVITPTTIN